MIVIEITTAHDDKMIENETNAIENGLAVIAGAKAGHHLDIRSQTQKILMTTDVVKRDATNLRELQNALPLLFEDVTLSNIYCPNKILTLYFSLFSEGDGTASRPRAVDKMDPDTSENSKASEDGDEDEDARMMALMGFQGFDSTKGKHVDGNQSGAAKLNKPRTWRQYMNRYENLRLICASIFFGL